MREDEFEDTILRGTTTRRPRRTKKKLVAAARPALEKLGLIEREKDGKDKKKDRFVTISHLADKAKDKILHEVRRHTKLMQKPVANEGHVLVNDYNAYVMGVHGYYSCATQCSKDFSEIAFLSRSALKNRLTPRRRKAKKPLPAMRTIQV